MNDDHTRSELRCLDHLIPSLVIAVIVIGLMSTKTSHQDG
jgi:hypothetical protein